MKTFTTELLIIGSGLAGLALALKRADHCKITLLSKDMESSSGNTPLAQGGISAVISTTDSFAQHIADTLDAGAGLCDPKVVRSMVEAGPKCIQDLIDWGVCLDRNENNEFLLTKEGAHSQNRILHKKDQTGKAIHDQLLHLVQAHPNIEIKYNQMAIELITRKQMTPYFFSRDRCLGAYVLNKKTDDVYAIKAKSVILATGGIGKAYLYTSNWSGSTGDGVAMAYRVGARVANLEFMQFHPTCLYHPEARNFLISEALRGEGGELVNKNGYPFMKDQHPLGSLAPRDVVARSIDFEMKQSGEECVFLDLTKIKGVPLEQRFPAIYSKCRDLGIDMHQSPIPVVPAAHYSCGGVMTDTHGQTDLESLYVLGESACSGLHGANRLASNSLLECLVMAENASQMIKQNWDHLDQYTHDFPSYANCESKNPDELMVISHMWEEVRHLMWSYVGIVRSTRRLQRAHTRILTIIREIKAYYSNLKTHGDIEELRNIALVAELTVRCALKRRNSIGIHYNIDLPQALTSSSCQSSSIINPLQQLDEGSFETSVL